MTRCQYCNAETSNGLTLCELCQRFAETSLQYIPVYFRNLARQRRPGRPNGSLGTTGQWLIQHGETDGSHVAPTLGRALNAITTYAIAIAETHGIALAAADNETDTITAHCGLLEQHLTHIATTTWAGQFVRDIARHEQLLRVLTETTVPGWYAGACQHVTGRTLEGDLCRCEAPTYVVPGLTWVTCPSCGNTSAARDHLETVLDEARGWVARPKRIAEAIVALLDTEQSVPRLYERIRKWEQRGKIQPHRHTTREHAWDHQTEAIVVVEVPTGYARFRLGDVLDLVLAKHDTTEELDANTTVAS